MNEDAKKLAEAFTDPAMTDESRASVLAYARGRLDAQKELKRQTNKTLPVAVRGFNIGFTLPSPTEMEKRIAEMRYGDG